MNYEEFLYNTFLGNGQIIWDIGGNIGKFSNFFGGKDHVSQVIVVEPFSANFNELINNTKHNPKIKCFRVALSDRKYTAKTIVRDCRTDEFRRQEDEIYFNTLLRFAEENNLEYPDFIKMDIEQMESIVLLDILEIYKTGHKMNVCVEVHAQPRGDDSDTNSDCPRFKYPDEGGIDFNDFKPYCNVYVHRAHSNSYSLMNENDDFNPKEGFYGMMILESKND